MSRKRGIIKKHLLGDKLSISFSGWETAQIFLLTSTQKKNIPTSNIPTALKIMEKLRPYVINHEKIQILEFERQELVLIYNLLLFYDNSTEAYFLMQRVRKTVLENLNDSDFESPVLQTDNNSFTQEVKDKTPN